MKAFNLPALSKNLEDWDLFERKVTNLFLLALGCDSAEKKIVGRFEVDCLASDPKSIYVVECKTRSEISKTNQKLRDYILTFAGKKVSISNALRTEDKERELVFIIATDGFEINEENIKLAKANGIYLWDGSYIKNVENLYKAIGPRTRQYILSNLEIPDPIEDGDSHKSLRIPALTYETTINGVKKRLYNLFLSAEHLLDLGFVYHIASGDPEAYQRIIQANRLKGMADFINDDNTFNSSVVVVLDEKVRFDGLGKDEGYEYRMGFLYIPKRKSSIKIIDGQHRLYAYEWAEESHKKDKLPVLALEQLSASEQAKIFLDINDYQKPVNKNDLNIIMSNIDPFGTGFLPNVILNTNETGFFKGRFITPYTTGKLASINLANAVKGLSDRKIFTASNPLIHDDINKIQPDAINNAAAILDHFFGAVTEVAVAVDKKWLDEFIFTNNGYNILLYLLAEVGKYDGYYVKNWLGNDMRTGLESYFRENKERIDDIRKMSSEGGRRENAKLLIYTINSLDNSFGAKFIKDFVPQTKKTRKTKGDYLEQISDIENRFKIVIRERLSEKTGINWWLTCVPESIRSRVSLYTQNESTAYVDVKNPSTKEDYLTFGDMVVIIDRNWSHFHDMLGQKGSALGSIESIKHVRDRLSHGKQVDDLSDDEMKSFLKAFDQLEKRTKSYSTTSATIYSSKDNE